MSIHNALHLVKTCENWGVSYTKTIRCLEETIRCWSGLPQSLVVWVLWKTRCKCVFKKVKQNVVELVKEIWLMLLHTLRGQYESITSEPEVVIHKQQQFREIWKSTEVFTYFRESIKWTYAPPRWFFPPPSWNNLLESGEAASAEEITQCSVVEEELAYGR